MPKEEEDHNCFDLAIETATSFAIADECPIAALLALLAIIESMDKRPAVISTVLALGLGLGEEENVEKDYPEVFANVSRALWFMDVLAKSVVSKEVNELEVILQNQSAKYFIEQLKDL